MKDIIYELATFQDDFINSDERVVSIIGAKGSGKAQPLTEPILTPNGWVTMGDLKVGDKVIGSNGYPCTVTGVFPQGEKQVYEIKLTTGQSAISCGEHLWDVRIKGKRNILTTAQIIEHKEFDDIHIPVLVENSAHFFPISHAIQKGIVECQCISVDAPDSLYVTRDYILTHNTWSGARYICREVAQQRNAQGLVMFNTLQQARDIYAQDVEPLLRELNWPYHFNQQSLILKVFDNLIHFRSAEPSALERIESVAYHWGWADEVSFYSPEALKTYVSRIRKGDARIRITSMPDEPDNFMYAFVEGLGGKMHEISLKDNPDRAFADRYEKFLRATYSGAQLDRFLSGKRVSLSGIGLFAVEPEMRIQGDLYDPDEELLLSWDFNVDYRAVSGWQATGHTADAYPIVTCVRSWQMKEATVSEDAHVLCSKLRKHKGRIVLHGDATGQARTAMATDSMWKAVKEIFYENFENVRYIVPKSNPFVKDTIQCLNWAIRSGLVQFNYDERNVYMSLQGAKADKYGELDKSKDYDGTTSAKSHDADTARYASWHYFSNHYPGRRGGLWIA